MHRPKDVIPCNGQYNHRILIGAMLAYEADTLQIALAEYDGVADVLITENRAIHNFREKKFRKPFLLWPGLKQKDAFKVTNSTVFSKNVREDDGVTKCGRQNRWITRMTNELAKYGKDYDVIIVGSVDEILARKTLLRLKYCGLPRLPASGAIGMPLKVGTVVPPPIGRSRKSSFFVIAFHLREGRCSQGNAKRHIPYLGSTVQGGLHMTNYCFLPAMVLKEMATEYGHQEFDVCRPLEKIKSPATTCFDTDY